MKRSLSRSPSPPKKTKRSKKKDSEKKVLTNSTRSQKQEEQTEIKERRKKIPSKKRDSSPLINSSQEEKKQKKSLNIQEKDGFEKNLNLSMAIANSGELPSLADSEEAVDRKKGKKKRRTAKDSVDEKSELVSGSVVKVIKIGEWFNSSQTGSIANNYESNLKKIYRDNERLDTPMLELVKQLELPIIPEKIPALPLQVFLSLEHQNAFSQIDQINTDQENFKTQINEKLQPLLDQWKQEENDEAFRAGMIKKLDLGVAEELEKLLATSYKLLTMESSDEKTKLFKELLKEEKIKTLVKGLDRKPFQEAIQAVKNWAEKPDTIKELKIDFPVTSEGNQWDKLVNLIDKAVKSENQEEWVPLYSLWKWSDGGFTEIEESLSQPWKLGELIQEHDQTEDAKRKRGQAAFEKKRDRQLLNALLLAAASFGANDLAQKGFNPEAMGIGNTFSWEKGWPDRGLGEIVLNQAMAATSTGPTTTISYSAPSNPNIWHVVRVFHQPKTAAMIQPLGGKKYWWQREALFPTANATMVLDRRQLDNFENHNGYEVNSNVGTTEIVIDASRLAAPVNDDRVQEGEHLNELTSEQEDETLLLIVDKNSREAHARLKLNSYKNRQDKEKDLILLKRDVENFDTEEIPDDWQDLYGQTRKNWQTALESKSTRKGMMSADYVKNLHKLIEPQSKDAGTFRDSDKRLQWSNLEEGLSDQTTLLMAQYHNLFVERSVDLSDSQEAEKLSAWANAEHHTTYKILATIPELPEGEQWGKRGANLKGFKEAITIAKNPLNKGTKFVDLTPDAWQRLNDYLKDQKKKPMKNTRSVYYSSADVWGGEDATFDTIIDEYLKGIEARTELQYRAFKTGIITRKHYIAWLQRTSAEIQQRLVAIHPFTDGNGRVSRAMMVKYLMLNLPVEEQKHWHDFLPTGDTSPDLDLQLGIDDYADALFPKTRDVLQPKLGTTIDKEVRNKPGDDSFGGGGKPSNNDRINSSRKEGGISEGDNTRNKESSSNPKGDGVNLSYQYEDIDMWKILTLTFPDKNQKGVAIMAPTDNIYVGQLEKLLITPQATDPYVTKLLVPYNLGNYHWVGIYIEKQFNGSVKVTYMDPLSLNATVPEYVEAELAAVYGKGNVEFVPKDYLTQKDNTSCGPITIHNLIALANNENPIQPNLAAKDIRKSHVELVNEKDKGNDFENRQFKNQRTITSRFDMKAYLNMSRISDFSPQEYQNILQIVDQIRELPIAISGLIMTAFFDLSQSSDEDAQLKLTKLRTAFITAYEQPEHKKILDQILIALSPGNRALAEKQTAPNDLDSIHFREFLELEEIGKLLGDPRKLSWGDVQKQAEQQKKLKQLLDQIIPELMKKFQLSNL